MARSPRQEHRDLPVDGTLRRVVVLYRLLGWAWMVILVVLTPRNDPGANMTIAFGALALATGWTALTVWAAGEADQLGNMWFVIGDIAVVLLVAASSTLAGAEDLFHGGYPLSTLAVVAYAFNLQAALGVSLIMGAEQVIVHVLDDRGTLPAVGSVTFVVVAILFGWAFDHLRLQERQRLAVQEELDLANADRVRHEERIQLANRLHDSVLQTLTALQRDAEDSGQVRYLARRQERQLRHTISEYRSPYAHSARAGVQAICEEVEDLYRIEVDAVIRGDAELDTKHEAILASAREALMNAAKHSGVPSIDLYAELDAERVQVFVRDRGQGFDPASSSTGRGLDHGLRGRAEAVGAVVTVATEPGGGTEVEILWIAS
ncbi:MAG: hypothetical protein U9N84_09030 [Actinomycetota bacterium]|nr:hypothetical protein [Actinomycetota bacterium]